jgi:hypothetical protein
MGRDLSCLVHRPNDISLLPAKREPPRALLQGTARTERASGPRDHLRVCHGAMRSTGGLQAAGRWRSLNGQFRSSRLYRSARPHNRESPISYPFHCAAATTRNALLMHSSTSRVGSNESRLERESAQTGGRPVDRGASVGTAHHERVQGVSRRERDRLGDGDVRRPLLPSAWARAEPSPLDQARPGGQLPTPPGPGTASGPSGKPPVREQPHSSGCGYAKDDVPDHL